jgi:hypothetical protein
MTLENAVKFTFQCLINKVLLERSHIHSLTNCEFTSGFCPQWKSESCDSDHVVHKA